MSILQVVSTVSDFSLTPPGADEQNAA